MKFKVLRECYVDNIRYHKGDIVDRTPGKSTPERLFQPLEKVEPVEEKVEDEGPRTLSEMTQAKGEPLGRPKAKPKSNK